jgi:acetyl-CoA synthetase
VDLTTPTVRATTRSALSDPDAFWAEAAGALPWHRVWERVFEWDPDRPDERGRYFRWFIGAQTNVAHNAIDRHVAAGRPGAAALICADERGGRRVFTYAQLLHEVRRTAAALRGLGIRRGDRVAVYMPTCAEAIVLMLACARIGAVHLVVFAGFGAGALRDRMQMAGAKALFCADVTYRKGQDVPLTGIVREVVERQGESLQAVVTLHRGPGGAPLQAARDLDWADFLTLGDGQPDDVEWVESNEPLYILATSGTTAKPKLAVHSHGAYQVYIHSMGKWVFGLDQPDVWWSTSDIGWVVGHSYIVYAPLLAGCTTFAYEGALDFPAAEAFYRIIEEHKVSGIFTSPTAVRMLMKYGTGPARQSDLGSLTRVVCAGEVLNAPAWEWLQKDVLQDRIPVIDHMWQTETSGPIFGNPWGIDLLPIKPGSCGIPLPGIDAEVVTPEGEPAGAGQKGLMVIRRPFPGLTATLWGEVDRYADDYWRRVPGRAVYLTGDAAEIDADGYVWFSGRADEIIKIAGHRIGTIEVETAFLRHPAVAEAGVTARPDPLRMEVISAFVVVKQGVEATDQLKAELLDTVRRELGPVAVVGDINFVSMLPKTRSGKIMRRVLKAVTLDLEPGDVSTIEDEASVQEARHAWSALRAEIPASPG